MTINIFATGTSRGIGKATVERLAGEDVRIIGHRSTEPDDTTLAADLTDPTAPRRIWEQALERLEGGRLSQG